MRKPSRAYIGIGSNLGHRSEHLRSALLGLGELGRVREASSVFETAPYGVDHNQPLYLNMAVALDTQLSAEDLLHQLQEIEQRHGRVCMQQNEPRTLDLDILLLEDAIIDQVGLIVPHPRMHLRPFVLVPLREIAPRAIHPRIGSSIAELADLAGVEGVRNVGNIENVKV